MSDSSAYRTFIRYVMLVARIEGEDQAIADIRDEMKRVITEDTNYNNTSDFMWEVSRFFPKLSTKVAFSFLAAWGSTGGNYGPRSYSDGDVKRLLVERLGARVYQGFCFDHADCCNDVELSMACYNGSHS